MPKDPIGKLLSGLGNVSGNNNSIAIHLAGESETRELKESIETLEMQVLELQKKMYNLVNVAEKTEKTRKIQHPQNPLSPPLSRGRLVTKKTRKRKVKRAFDCQLGLF